VGREQYLIHGKTPGWFRHQPCSWNCRPFKEIAAMIQITVNRKAIAADYNDTILKAAQRADIYIPTLCYHPDLPPGKGGLPVEAVYQGALRFENHPAASPEGIIPSGCGLCAVELVDTGELKPACSTHVSEGMQIITDSEQVKRQRQEKLVEILAFHPHTCLTCAQNDGCPRTQCSANVPEHERCCARLGNCELQKVSDYVGISPATPKWVPTNLPTLEGDPLLTRNYNLCISCTRCVRACRDLRGIDAMGFVFDETGKVLVGSVGPTLKDSGCKFCTACVEVCPTGAIMDKGISLAAREDELVPCVAACPAGINIPWYLRFIADNKADEAGRVIRERVPLPGILGRVCVRPCESACRRGQVNEPISICALKRFASDNEQRTWKSVAVTAPDTGKRVAIVGAGPAGLTAAFYLRKKGHAVSVFDSHAQPGGMMRYGIPRYRLPSEILDKEIGDIFAMGVDFKPSTTVGKDISLVTVRHEYDAVFLAGGAQLSRKIPLEGVDLPQVLWGFDFLREVNLDKDVRLDGKVVVIGGGAVAIDVALSARRVGARQVELVCLEDRDEMPAHSWEIQEAEEEGVRIHNCWGPMEVVESEGGVRGICFKKCVCVFDAKGHFNPSYDEECTMGLEADTAILAIGQSSDLDFLSDVGVNVHNRLIEVDDKTLQTNIPGIFAGGDAVVFAGAIIHAIAAGRHAASSVDKYLGGDGNIDQSLVELPPLNHRLGREEGFADLKRIQIQKIPVSERSGFREVDLGFRDGDAREEAKRCLQCDLRLALGKIRLPPEHVMAFTRENVEKVSEEEGAFRLMNETKKPILIKGCDNMRELLLEYLEEYPQAKFFDYEEDKMYSKRESELVRQHLQKYGEMPSAGGEDDDLF
jgi:NADPH-dependent glutamate synthase beta subunit-like oxidoreductase